jgi:hypothetical protein
MRNRGRGQKTVAIGNRDARRSEETVTLGAVKRERKLVLLSLMLMAVAATIIILRGDRLEIVVTGVLSGMLVYLPPVILALWLIEKLRQRKRDKRIKAGLCVKCGYDLRATPDRCPECGTVAVKPAEAN